MAGNLEISANPDQAAQAAGHRQDTVYTIIHKAPHVEAPCYFGLLDILACSMIVMMTLTSSRKLQSG
jgi:hypothetical protein